MKKVTKNTTQRTAKVYYQKGFIKNWAAGTKNMQKKRTITLFVIGLAIVGSYFVMTSMAQAKPRFWGNADYWGPRVRACMSGVGGEYGKADYKNYIAGTDGAEAVSGAYLYSETGWNNYGGYAEAYLAPQNVQDEKFASDWSNPAIGSKPWEESIFCWKPRGSISGAPCLPVPKNTDNVNSGSQNTNENNTESASQ